MNPLVPILLALAAGQGTAAPRGGADVPLAPAVVTAEPVPPEAGAPPPSPTELAGDAAPAAAAHPLERVAASDPTWLDSGRRFANRTLYAAVDRFDGFFGDDRMADIERPRSRIRLRNDLVVEDDGSLGYGISVKTTLKLPRMDRLVKNARLVVTSATADAFADDDGSDEGSSAAADPSAPRPRAGNVELRFDLFRTVRFSSDAGGGLKFNGVKPVPYGRIRFHARRPIGDHVLVRLTQGFTYELELWGNGPSSSTELRVEGIDVGRLRGAYSATARWKKERPGFSVDQLAWIGWMVQPQTGIYTGVRWRAYTRPLPVVDSYGLYLGVRRDLYRGWVYGQLEPALLWRDGEAGTLQPVRAVMVRLDLVFDTRPDFQ